MKRILSCVVLLCLALAFAACGGERVCTNIKDMQEVIASELRGKAIEIYGEEKVDDLWIVSYTADMQHLGVAVFDKNGEGYTLYHNYAPDKMVERAQGVWVNSAAVLNKETEEMTEVYFFVSMNRELSVITYEVEDGESVAIQVDTDQFPSLTVIPVQDFHGEGNWQAEYRFWDANGNEL